MPTVKTEQTVEIKLAPQLKTKILRKLRQYAELKLQAKAIESAQAKIRQETEAAFADAGEFAALQAGIRVDDFRVCHVSPVRTTLDKQRLIAEGVTVAQIEAATLTVPGRAYLKITVPGAGRDEE
jgi:hypothetical protein